MSADEFKNKGNVALQAGNFDEAIAMYSEAINLDSSNHVFYSNRSAAYLSKNDAENALADANICVELNKSWPKGYGRKGAALHALKRYQEAINSYNEGLSVAPNDEPLKKGLSEVEKAKASVETPNPFGGNIMARILNNPKFRPYFSDPVFLQKLQSLQQNPNNISQCLDDPRMMEVLSFLMGIDPNMMKGEGGQGGGGEDEIPMYTPPPKAAPKPAPREEKDPDAGLSEEEREIKQRKRKAIASKEKGNELYKEKKFDEAIQAYDEAISIDDSNISFYTNKAAVHFEMKHYDECITICQNAIEIGRGVRADFADIAKAFVRIGKAYLKLDDYDGALKAFESAQVENYQKDIEKLVKQVKQEQKEKAVAAYINPELAIAAKERGNELFRNGKFAESIKEYEDATKRDPTSAVYLNNLASALSKMMDFNGAKAACEKALAIDPKYVKAWHRKGEIELFMKEYHKALESFEKGLQIEPSNQACKDGIYKTRSKINTGNSNDDMERAQHGMADPEIQAILMDPVIRNVLNEFQENPREAQKALANPDVARKIEKLIAAGVLKTG